jgi:hypothetical protein
MSASRVTVVALLTAVGCAGTSPPSASPAATGSVHRAAIRDERGRGIVRLSEADDGRVVLVDLGQRLDLTLSRHFVAPYLVGASGPTGQDRVLYLQQSSGYPDPAHARLLAGNPGDVVVRAHDPSCSSTCTRAQIFDVHIYAGTVPHS